MIDEEEELILIVLLCSRNRPCLYREPRNPARVYLKRLPFWNLFRYTNSREFRNLFRMGKQTFVSLLHTISPRLEPLNHHRYPRNYRDASYYLSAPLRLGMALRVLGGGQLCATGFLFGCSEFSVRKALSDVMKAILADNKVGALDFDPENENYLEEKSQLFQNKRPSTNIVAPFCVGAIDGLSIHIMNPRHFVPANDYFCPCH